MSGSFSHFVHWLSEQWSHGWRGRIAGICLVYSACLVTLAAVELASAQLLGLIALAGLLVCAMFLIAWSSRIADRWTGAGWQTLSQLGLAYAAGLLAGIAWHWTASLAVILLGVALIDQRLWRSGLAQLNLQWPATAGQPDSPTVDLPGEAQATAASPGSNCPPQSSETQSSQHQTSIDDPTPPGQSPTDGQHSLAVPLLDAEDEMDVDEELDAEALPLGVCRQTTDACFDGERIVTTAIRVSIPAGQALTIVQAPVFPNFEYTPRCELLQVGGPEVRMRVTQSNRFGVRAEVQQLLPSDQLQLQTEDLEVELEICQRAALDSSSSATQARAG